MAGGSLGGDDDDLIVDINVTPLVDVVLVLLIILMVTATAIVSKTLPVELPTAEGETTPTTPTTLGITIDESGALFLDREPMTLEELEAAVARAKRNDADVRAILAADGRIRHARVVQIIDLLRRLQVTKFAINVRQSDLEDSNR